MSPVIFKLVAEKGGAGKRGAGEGGAAGRGIAGDGAKPRPGRPASAAETLPLESIKGFTPEAGGIAYVDLGGLDGDAARKAIAALRKRCGDSAWGVVDPDSAIADPAALFHDGASDYLGPAMAGAGVTRQRVKAALAYNAAKRTGPEAEADGPVPAQDDAEFDTVFKGWNALKAGEVYPFYFLYASVGGPTNLKTRLGESGYAALRDRIRSLLQQALAEANPQLWMETEVNSLYLLPPSRSAAEAAIQASLRLLLSTPLVAYEKIGLPFPVEFTFAMHRGKTEYAQPGRTGTIVSDAVNFIFHLGAKRAVSSSLTVSAEAAAIPAPLADVFIDDGAYEGRKLIRSRRFG